MAEDKDRRMYRLMAYGVERKGLTPPAKPIVDRNYSVTFEKFDTPTRFNEVDGVIIMQGIFESFKEEHNWMGESYETLSCHQDQLDRRTKEAELMIQQGGFACFVLCKPFMDRVEGRRCESTDLAKRALNIPDVYRKNFGNRVTGLAVKRDEFRNFLQIYGAANSYFENYSDAIDWRVLAEYQRATVAMVLEERMFFIPALLPENSPERVHEFFSVLADALTSTLNRFQVEVPDWVKKFQFETERGLEDARILHLKEIEEIDSQLSGMERFKRVLLFDGEALVEAVAEVLRSGFGFNVNDIDELREDLKITDDDGTPILFVEIKGTNKGVKREHINQADSHRERADMQSDFPVVLLVNTHIKNSRSIAEKDQPVPQEQVRHAVKANVLIMRTFDLLGLLKLRLANKLTKKEVLSLVCTDNGWLKVDNERIEVLKE